MGRLGLGWYHISYRSYNAVRPPLSPRSSPALYLSFSFSVFLLPSLCRHLSPCSNPPAYIVTLALSFISLFSSFPFLAVVLSRFASHLSLRRPLFHAYSPRVSPHAPSLVFFISLSLSSSFSFLHLCVSAASSHASCLHFALTFSPPRLLVRSSVLLPFLSFFLLSFSLYLPVFLSLCCIAAAHLRTFLFLLSRPRADPPFSLPIYQRDAYAWRYGCARACRR